MFRYSRTHECTQCVSEHARVCRCTSLSWSRLGYVGTRTLSRARPLRGTRRHGIRLNHAELQAPHAGNEITHPPECRHPLLTSYSGLLPKRGNVCLILLQLLNAHVQGLSVHLQ